MAVLFRSLMHSKQILCPSNLSIDVPKGYLAVYVGENQKKRFIVPVTVLNQPSFQELLTKAEEEFGSYQRRHLHQYHFRLECMIEK